jgi:hypothetical protein
MRSNVLKLAGAAVLGTALVAAVSTVEIPATGRMVAAVERGIASPLAGLALHVPLSTKSCGITKVTVSTSGPQILSGWLFNLISQLLGIGCRIPA